jgi:hypothetical protein
VTTDLIHMAFHLRYEKPRKNAQTDTPCPPIKGRSKCRNRGAAARSSSNSPAEPVTQPELSALRVGVFAGLYSRTTSRQRGDDQLLTGEFL